MDGFKDLEDATGLRAGSFENLVDFAIAIGEKLNPVLYPRSLQLLSHATGVPKQSILTLAEGTLILSDDFFGNEEQERERESQGRYEFFNRVRSIAFQTNAHILGAS